MTLCLSFAKLIIPENDGLQLIDISDAKLVIIFDICKFTTHIFKKKCKMFYFAGRNGQYGNEKEAANGIRLKWNKERPHMNMRGIDAIKYRNGIPEN